MPEKQLELSRRNAFFSDPFFSDLRAGLGGGDLERRLAEFSARSMGLAAGSAALTEAAHNIQVSASNDKFQIQLELPGFAPEDFALKTKDDIVIVEAVHNTAEGSRKFTREFKMPAGVVREQLASTYSGKGILTVSAPRVLTAPEGAQISEAMKAQSQAFVTEDGTAVKKDEKASSQSIAAVTQSPDGSTTSSFKSTSSSSSSSTMMSSGGPMPGGSLMMSGLGGGMPSLLGGGGGMPSLDMDSMMSKMMGDMGSISMGSSSSSMSKSSMVSSSFSSSSSSSMMSSNMSSLMGGMGGLPPMRGMEMMPPGLSFEEMASMPPTASTIGERPEYTVTSPPMSPPPPAAHEMSHRVEQTEDYVPPTTETAEATVLVRVKDGDEYKLALNMQQFSPEDITIKLNGQELSIEAANGGESFRQKHVIPDNIDLDAMSSSFSSDGVLVIKAPKK
jgi:HSP20 family molecular chaperone IbpA